MGFFAHGGYSHFGIRLSPEAKANEKTKEEAKKEHLAYTSLITTLREWESRGLMSVSFFCCNTARPRSSAFVALGNIFPSVMFAGFAVPLTKTEVLESKVPYLMEYFALHSMLVDETKISEEEKVKLRRKVVQAVKNKIKEKADPNSRVCDVIFFNSK